nr:hypothetical protein [Tanacetum cinerariifolium]
MDLKLCYNTFKLKEGENLTQTFTIYRALMNELDFQDSPADEEDTRNSQEYMNDLEIKCHFARDCFSKTLVASTSKSSQVKNQGLIAEAYKWDEEEVSSDDNEMVKVKIFMALADDESGDVGKESVRNGEWAKISMRKEQRNNLVIKHRDIVQELNTCKEKLLELKQTKLDFLTMQHVTIKILKENQNLRKELKELTEITKTWLKSSDKLSAEDQKSFSEKKKKEEHLR